MNHRKQIELMDLSLGRSSSNNKDNNEANLQGSSSSTSCTNNNEVVEKEHMFDKVVTPSDVGKLNRLVIPKQHAEKYFPLDSSANEKGLLLNFEDRSGKLWRFRYSYWNSSQSYVMTKGWSRFVKDKKLDAGDIVSFQRGLGDLYRHRLYIDWRRRPDHAPDHHHLPPTIITPLFVPNQAPHPHYSIRWGGRLYSLPSPNTLSTTVPPHHDPLNCNNMYTLHQHREQYQHGAGNPSHHPHNNYLYNEMNSGSGPVCYLMSTPSMSSMGDQQHQQQERGNINIAPIIIDSVPVAHHHHHCGGPSGAGSSTSTAAKRLRLFGVNMECASSSSSSVAAEESSAAHVTMANSVIPSSNSLPPFQLSPSARLGDQRGATSLFFDLNPTLRHRQ